MATTLPVFQLTPEQLVASSTSVWRQILKQYSADHRSAVPAFLAEDMDVATQTVTVQIAIQERVRTQTGAQWWDLDPVQFVPVVMPRGGGFAQTLPLKKGDEGLLIFCDNCFDNWWVNGQNGSPPAQNTNTVSGSQTQREVRRHHFWDCGFIPGMWSQPNVLSDYSADTMQLRTDDGSVYVELADSAVNIQAPAVVAGNGGTALPLVNDNFYQWFVTDLVPFLTGLGYTGAPVPVNSETTVLKGE